MKAIKNTPKNTWTGFMVFDFRIFSSYLWYLQKWFSDDYILPDF